MQITGTHFNYFMLCHRKLWLFANGIQMEQNSDLVYEGKLIHETSYPQRSDRYSEVEIDGIKIDYYDVRNKIVHEIKKSDKHEEAHEWQVKYYMFVLEKHGVDGVTSILEYPKLRETHEVLLSDVDREEIREFEKDIERIIASEECPDRKLKSKCRNCSYLDFCFAGELTGESE
ncbi:MAG: CRISPR-associated protein Cas4 [Bacteroidales bacterium]|nr:CRISPR-associated protein Cas4 [Bacteroidales bacterium]